MVDIDFKDIGEPEDRIIEEAAEVIKAVVKGKRFGWDKHHPDRPYVNNFNELYNEIMDLLIAFNDFREKLEKK